MAAAKIETVPIGEIKPDPNQPRTEWDQHQEHIERLKLSVKEIGIIDPITIDETNMILFGECRWRAAKKAGMREVPVLRVQTPTPEDRLKMQLTEDIHRKRFIAIERMWAFTAAVCSINTGKYYSVSKVKRMYEKGEIERINLNNCLGLSNGGRSKVGGVAELARSTQISQPNIHRHLQFWDKDLPQSARDDFLAGHIKYTDFDHILVSKKTRVREAMARGLAEDRKTKSLRERTSAHTRSDAVRNLEKAKAADELVIATARGRIRPEIAERVASRVPVQSQAKIAEKIQHVSNKEDALTEAEITEEILDIIPKKELVEMPEVQIAEIQERVREQTKRLAEKRADPEVQRKARLFQSWLRLGAMLDLLDDTICPICETPAVNNLTFKCHPEMTIEKARVQTEKARGIEPVERGEKT